MEVVAMILFVIGGILSVVGGIWLLVVAFSESILWGLGCLLIPLVSLIFVIMYWQKAAKPFLISLLGTIIVLGGMWLSPTTTSGLG